MFLSFLLALIRHSNVDEEKELIERIIAGDEKAFSKLYDLYSKLIFSIAFRILKNSEEAEDLMQNIFLQIWNKASFFIKDKGNVYSWIVTITRNRAIDEIRSKDYKKHKESYELDSLRFLTVEKETYGLDAAIIKERRELVLNALNQIPPEQKKVIELAYFEGYTQAEISEYLNVPLGTIKTRARMALNKLEIMLSSIL